MIITLLKAVVTFFIISGTSSSFTLFFTGISLIVIPISNGITSGLAIGNKVIYETLMRKCNKSKKQ